MGSAPANSRLDVIALTIFCFITFAVAWLLTLPLWLARAGLANPLTSLILPLMMFCPTLGVLGVLVLRSGSVKPVSVVTGLRVSNLRTLLVYCLLAWVVVPGLVLAAPFVGVAFGLYHLDLTNFSEFAELIRSRGGSDLLKRIPIQSLVVAQFFSLPLAPLLNVPFSFGEEWGWRGFLLPKLLPLGQWNALVISGAIWGIWHAPIILLGYNYPQHPGVGVGLMLIFCIIIGVLFGWLRLAAGNIWPCVVAHGTLNGSAGISYVLSDSKAPFDTTQATILGWTGWILPLVVILALVLTRRLPVRGSNGERKAITRET
jgi:uncharacterized protein